MRNTLLSVDPEPQPALAHRRQVGPTGNYAYVDISARQLDRH
jgi:hypothetical protein